MYLQVVIATEALASKMKGTTPCGRRVMLAIENARTTVESSADRNHRQAEMGARTSL